MSGTGRRSVLGLLLLLLTLPLSTPRGFARVVAAGDGNGDGDEDSIRPGRVLRFPRDHGAHPGSRTEWWYATGWLGERAESPRFGFQITFFRSRTDLAATAAGRFAAPQLLFAHAAITDLAARRHRHAQRLQRWNADERGAAVHAASDDTRLAIGPWTLVRGPATAAAPYRTRIVAPEAGLKLALELKPTQPVLLQGEAGFSRKGPLPGQASHYYSQPQLAVHGELTIDGRSAVLSGRGWLDHEWSEALLADGAVGWDWIGINLLDGAALTAFRLRRADGSALWAGGSWRDRGHAVGRNFAAHEVVFVSGREWVSPASGARYPVQWRIESPAGRFTVEALLDAQEIDSRASTGAIYWEGLAELRDDANRRVGLGYLEMTGRAAPLRL